MFLNFFLIFISTTGHINSQSYFHKQEWVHKVVQTEQSDMDIKLTLDLQITVVSVAAFNRPNVHMSEEMTQIYETSILGHRKWLSIHCRGFFDVPHNSFALFS